MQTTAMTGITLFIQAVICTVPGALCAVKVMFPVHAIDRQRLLHKYWEYPCAFKQGSFIHL